ncbi:MAG: CBS domain-containing protein [Nitrospirales bacterium]|nr:CBS domain-containing protein [Nitrospirales bacterium]
MTPLRHIMRKELVKTSSHASILEAAQRMCDDRISALLIERNGEIVGIVTDTDLVRRGIASERDLRTTTVSTIMTTPLLKIESTQSIEQAHDMMGNLGVRHLVVCEGGSPVGIVSVRDLLVHFQRVSESNRIQD